MHGDIPCSSDWVSYPILFSTGYLFLWLQQERFVANWQMITFFSFKKKSRANWNEWCIWDYCFSYPFGVSNCWMIHISLPGSETLPPAASDPWQEKKICREQSKKQHICGSSWKSGKEDNHSMDPMGYCKVRLSDWMMAKLILKALFPFTKWFSLYGSRINGLGIFPASSIYLKRFSTSRKSRFWSDKFNEEMCDLKFCLISGVEHPPTIFTGMGEIHQTPWLNSICVITSSQIKMSWKLGGCRYLQHMATQGQPQDESEGNQTVAQKLPSTGNESEWELEFLLFIYSVYNHAKSWGCLGGSCVLATAGVLSSLRPGLAMLWTPLLILMYC